MHDFMTEDQAGRALAELNRAVRLAGSWQALADALALETGTPLTAAGAHKWSITGVPPRRAVELENLFNGAVLRQELRPDLYDGLRSHTRIVEGA